MKSFLNYLWEKKALILFFVFCVCCFLIVFSLYSLPLEAVGYAFLLCCVGGFLFAGYSFWKRREKLSWLVRLEKRVPLGLIDLPPAAGALEEEYQRLLSLLLLENRRLAASQEQKLRDMTDYYTLWAHQIKTPIAAMGLLLQSEKGEGAFELSGELFKIEQYVEMVLNYLRLDSDSTDFSFRSCDLDPIVKAVLRKFSRWFIGKKLSLRYEALDIRVLTDEKWLSFLLEQLLSNALKYTEEGSISIYLLPEQTLVIEDTGIGIAPEDLPRVFDRGFTGLNGREDKRSTGIGLFLCRQIAEKLGHTLTLQSELGKGTRAMIGLSHYPMEAE